MSYNINAVVRRVVLSGSAGTGPYAFSFEIISNTDVEVYKDTTKLTLTTDYAVTINANGTGSVALNTGTTNVPNAPTSANTITIIGSRDIERTTDFVTAGDLTASSLNEQLDSLTIFDQQISERVDRALIGNRSDPLNLSMELPAVDARKGKYLQFNSSTGAPEAGASSSDATTLASIASDIANLADIEDGTIATDAISGLAAIKANVTTVAGISGNVTTVAGISGNVTTVAGQTANLTNVTNNLSAIQGAAQAASDASDSAIAAAASASSLTTGISENNTLQADAGLVDDDFLRIKGTKIEGRSAAELRADIGATTVGAAVFTAANVAAAQQAQDLEVGVDVQAFDADTVKKDVTNVFTKAQVPSTNASSGLTLDFDTYQNFFVTLSAGANTLANPSTEDSNVGQTGVIIFIQPSSGSAATLSIESDYETAGGVNTLTISATNNAYDVVPYLIKANNSILLGASQLAFS